MKSFYQFLLLVSIPFLLNNSKLNAQVVYTDISPDYKISEGNYNIDINNDGVFDMSLEFEYTGNQYQQHYNTYLNPNSNVSVLAEVDWMTTSHISLKGDTIGPNSDWQSTNKITTQLGIRPDGPFIPAWNTIKEGYLAIRIKVENQYHYGYLRLYYNDYYHYYLSLADFVYCSNPNCEIIAGLDIPNVASSLYTEVENTFYDGRDITVSFTKAIDESLFSEYRVFIAKENDESANNIEYLRQLTEEYYVSFPTNLDESFNISHVLYESTVSIDGESIKPFIDYRIHILNVGFNDDPEQDILSIPSDLFHLTKPLTPLEKLFAQDINNTSTAEDIMVLFSEAQENLPIQEYRIFVTNQNLVYEFNLETALQLPESYYTQIQANQGSYQVILKPNQLTTSGENIHNNAFYNIFILSVIEEGSPMTSVLSLPSRKIVLRTPNCFYAGQKTGENISWFTYDTILSNSPVWGSIDDQHSSGTMYIDVNRDGRKDFKLIGALYEHDGTTSFKRNYQLSIIGERENKVLTKENEYHSFMVEVLNEFEMIDQGYVSSSQQKILIDYKCEEFYESGNIHVDWHYGFYPGIPNVPPNNDYYIGLEINDLKSSQFAWIKLNGYQIVEYAYQDISYGLDDDINSKNSFSIFPNPSSDFFQIKSNNNSIQKNTVIIFNQLGSIVENIKLNIKGNIISTKNYPSGLYFVQITNANGQAETHKLIIE